ncbi:MAG: DUF4440 domain-containing protein [Propionicimonas sp.]|nr:DUF4440 domain-containing protein [Propionicimonas sp.]
MATDETLTDLRHPVLALETAAMHRWLSGDPDGFLELSADDVVYTDPVTEGWIVGREGLTALYRQLRGLVHAERFAFLDPRVVEGGGLAVLTFDLESWDDGSEPVRWHCTEAYRKDDGGWRIVATHWSRPQRPQQ